MSETGHMPWTLGLGLQEQRMSLQLDGDRTDGRSCSSDCSLSDGS